jgi:hypothetical protein
VILPALFGASARSLYRAKQARARKVRCSTACTFALALVLDSKTGKRVGLAERVYVVGTKTGRLRSAGTKTVLVTLSKKAKRSLRKARSFGMTVKLTAKDAAGNVARKSAKVTIKR